MSNNSVRTVWAWEALDSRGLPTVGCKVTLEGGGQGRAIVPAGKSKGGHEARERRDGGERYGGRGAQQAVAAVNDVLAAAVVGLDAEDQSQLDAVMESVDGDPQLANLGANAVLGVSLATALAFADQSGRPLWRALAGDGPALLPRPMVNMISGGAHAGAGGAHGPRTIDIQDVLVVPLRATTFAQCLEWAWRARKATADLLARAGVPSGLVADEGGVAGWLGTNEAAISTVTDALEMAGFVPGQDVGIAIDLAANQFYSAGTYNLGLEGVQLSPAEWLERVSEWCRRYPVISLEDVLYEDDWANWGEASRRLGQSHQLIGDDLFATDLARLNQGLSLGVANAVLVKPDQAGTLSRTSTVLRAAQAGGYATVVSARSGDTEDYWLADLAVGWRAGQVKVGSTQRSERTAKWNRLLEIEADAGGRAELWHP